MQYFLYCVIINITAFVMYGWDKYCAKKNKWRVSELTLLTIALLGGSIGAFMAMKLFHHKTLHLKFKYGVPLILIFHESIVTERIAVTFDALSFIRLMNSLKDFCKSWGSSSYRASLKTVLFFLFLERKRNENCKCKLNKNLIKNYYQ